MYQSNSDEKVRRPKYCVMINIMNTRGYPREYLTVKVLNNYCFVIKRIMLGKYYCYGNNVSTRELVVIVCSRGIGQFSESQHKLYV